MFGDIRDCAIITWKGGGNQRGKHRVKSQLERGGLDVKFNTYGGALLFLLFFTNWKSGRRAISQSSNINLYMLTLELNWENINSRCFGL